MSSYRICKTCGEYAHDCRCQKRASGSLERVVGKHVIQCIRTELTQDKTTVENRDVILMAVCGNYSMVRLPGCIPYVCKTRDLLPNVKISEDAGRKE